MSRCQIFVESGEPELWTDAFKRSSLRSWFSPVSLRVGRPERQDFDPAQFEKLWRAMRDTPSLATACVLHGDLSAGTLELRILVDSAGKKEQAKTIELLAAKTLGMPVAMRQTYSLPLDGLLQKLKGEIGTNPKFKGCELHRCFATFARRTERGWTSSSTGI